MNIPSISGKDKVFFGTRKDDNTGIYLDKPTFDCEWYWSFGSLGNKNCCYRLNSYQTKTIFIKDDAGKYHSFTIKRNLHMRDALLEDYALNPVIEANLWTFCELSLSIYTLKAAADLFHIGGSHTTTNPGKDNLKNNEIYKKLVSELIPAQCQLLWNLIEGNKK